jgi:hypothetical protein
LFTERVEKLQKIMRDNAIGALFLHPCVNTALSQEYISRGNLAFE